MSLKIERLSVSLRGRRLLRDLTFEAHRGELLAIVGPNGAGKTTLLKAIAALIEFDGKISWDNQQLAEFSPVQRAKTLAYLPQGHVAYWPITSRDVVTIGRAPFSSDLTQLQDVDLVAIDEALETVGALEFADRAITELSGGERARVMLARAIVVGAPLLLADEPVTSLDPAHQLLVMTVLSQQAKEGRLIICVSHDLLLAARFADRVLVLDEGRMAALGSVEDTLTKDLLGEVFGLETMPVTIGGQNFDMPWRPVSHRL